MHQKWSLGIIILEFNILSVAHCLFPGTSASNQAMTLLFFFFYMLILSSKDPVQKAPLAAWHLTISFEVRSANFHSHLQHLFFIAFALACPHMYDIFHFLVFLFSSLLAACFGHSIGIPLMPKRLFSERTYHHHKHCLSQSTKLFFLLKGCSHILER